MHIERPSRTFEVLGYDTIMYTSWNSGSLLHYNTLLRLFSNFFGPLCLLRLATPWPRVTGRLRLALYLYGGISIFKLCACLCKYILLVQNSKKCDENYTCWCHAGLFENMTQIAHLLFLFWRAKRTYMRFSSSFALVDTYTVLGEFFVLSWAGGVGDSQVSLQNQAIPFPNDTSCTL